MSEEKETPQQAENIEVPAEPEDAVTEPKSDSEPKAEPDIQLELQEEQAAAEEEEDEVDEEEPEDGVPRVLVTGASGFIALQLVKALLEDGRFRVRGTVRNKKNKEKIQPLLDLVPNTKYPLRLIEADLQNAESWAKAIKSCSYVFHLASPCTFKTIPPEEEEEKLIRPAVDGTINVLQACADAGTVKRVILTSSIAAVSNGISGNPNLPPDHIYDESDWSDEASCGAYERSKTKAERAAWDFVKKLEANKMFELVVLNPGYVRGPLLSRASGEATKSACLRLFSGELFAIPNVYFPIIDVRDVVAANIAAMEKPEAVGKRYILVSETIKYRDVAQYVSEEFKPQGYKIPTMPLPKIGVWLEKFFDAEAKRLYPLVGKFVSYNNEKMVSELGINPCSAKESVIDLCYSLIDLGDVKKTPSYLGHPSTRPPPPSTEKDGNDLEPVSAEPASENTAVTQEPASEVTAVTHEPPSENTAVTQELATKDTPKVND